MKKKLFKNDGFTLVELLVVISILATLMAVLMPNFMGTRKKARDSKKVQDMQAIKNALRLYYNDNQNYPVGDGLIDISSDIGTYLPAISEIGYTYYQTDGGDGFVLCSGIESGMGDSDVDSQRRCGIETMDICGLGVGVSTDGIYVVCAN